METADSNYGSDRYGLLAQLLRDQAGVLADILRQATARVDEIEDKVLTNRISVSRTELGALRRVLIRLQQLLAPEPAALFRLLSRPPAWIGGEDVQNLREAAEEFSVAVADSAALGERVKLLQEELAGDDFGSRPISRRTSDPSARRRRRCRSRT